MLCFSWFFGCVVVAVFFFVSYAALCVVLCWWSDGFSLYFALPLGTLAFRLRLSNNREKKQRGVSDKGFAFYTLSFVSC